MACPEFQCFPDKFVPHGDEIRLYALIYGLTIAAPYLYTSRQITLCDHDADMTVGRAGHKIVDRNGGNASEIAEGSCKATAHHTNVCCKAAIVDEACQLFVGTRRTLSDPFLVDDICFVRAILLLAHADIRCLIRLKVLRDQ